MLKLDADRHNFGQFVEPMERASFLYYRKPRPVFWEHLFFGRDSEIASFFSEVGENGSRPLGSSLFNLEVDVESDWLGYSKEVKRSEAPVAPEYFYSFGVLLAYAFVFGIRDLHKFNLIKTNTHLQVIDAEVVLTNLTLPNETILLPFKDVSFEFSAASLLTDSMESFTSDQRRLIYAGYFDLFALVFRKQKELLVSLQSVLTDAPIRIIIRNTRIYADHLNGKSEITDMLNEEKIQLDRGDVPYFFKHVGDSCVCWVSSPEGARSAVRALRSFQPDVDRHAQPPDLLIGNAGVIERKMAQGAFLMQRKFGASEVFEFAWNGRPAKLGPGHFSNGYSGHEFRSKTKL